jgi:hypothetical protein
MTYRKSLPHALTCPCVHLLLCVVLWGAGGQLPAQPDADGGRGLTRNANLAGGQHNNLVSVVMHCSTVVATVAHADLSIPAFESKVDQQHGGCSPGGSGCSDLH